MSDNALEDRLRSSLVDLAQGESDRRPAVALISRRARRRRVRTNVIGAAVALACTAALIGIVASTHGSVPDRLTTASKQPPRLSVLFTRTSPNGITVTARAGLVPVAEVNECPVVPVPPTVPPSRYCTNARAAGVQFDFAAAGRTYRVTVLDRDTKYGSGSLRPMNTLALIREVRSDGSSVSVDRWRGELAVLYSQGLARVRINPSRSVRAGRDVMTPVNGWVAFPAFSSARPAFDLRVQGLDAQDHVVATALPYRCC